MWTLTLEQNDATSAYAAVLGGLGNVACGQHATVAGGASNTSSGSVAAVGGGHHNASAGYASSVSGSLYITASADEELAPGPDGRYRVSAEILDPASGAWAPLPDVPDGRTCEARLVSLPDGSLLLKRGQGSCVVPLNYDRP